MSDSHREKELSREVVGLIPAGGEATRIAPLPCSKELYPVGFRPDPDRSGLRPKVVGHYLLEKMRFAGVTKVYVILRKGKWDIPAYLGDGTMLNLNLAYLIMRLPFGVPYTLDQAYPFVQNTLVAFGFPDILFDPEDAFKRLLVRQEETKADMVLGLFPVDQPEKWDMVKFKPDGQVEKILKRPRKTKLSYTWIISVWTSVFTDYMHCYLGKCLKKSESMKIMPNISGRKEISMGDIIQKAIEGGLIVQSVLFQGHRCLDIGSPDGLVQANKWIQHRLNK